MQKNIRKTVNDLCDKYRSRDPFELCRCLNITVREIILSDNVRGVCVSDENGMAIGIHESLPDHIKRFVCGHELAHLIMHQGINSVFLEMRTRLSTAPFEKDADLFSMFLLYPDDSEFLSIGDTVDKITAVTGCSEALVQLRLKAMYN